MKEDNSIMYEMREMIKTIVERQELLLAEIKELKEEQKKLLEEVKINNFVLNNISLRNEILN